jgi:mRNA-degrading endonuclease RelE of RelBE toxin-antitoxin system
MKYTTVYTKDATHDLAGLPKKIARRIVDKIEFFRTQPEPLHFAKRLTNFEPGQFRFRIGDYRAIFDVDSKGAIHILMILRIKHRKDIYNL